ncbi:hypothetical protein SLS62_006318 [Diatrype stigma]|uniref:Uncharacterized protein n=1 Tax=Diatrype stigma TaxID=117547 RepID=A0AAN9V174_9PEZI
MKLTPLLFLGLLTSLGTADDAPPEPVAQWTLSSASRNRSANGTTCHWGLTIRDDASGMPAEHCHFTVKADASKPCNLVQFSDIPCAAESDWVMNGGFSEFQQFMVVIVYNAREQAKAYFGFQSRALDEGKPIPKQINPAFSTNQSNH